MRTQFFLVVHVHFLFAIIRWTYNLRGHMLRCVSKPDKFRVRFQTFDRQMRSICLSNDDHAVLLIGALQRLAIMTNFQAQRDFADSSKLLYRRSVERRRSRVTYDDLMFPMQFRLIAYRFRIAHVETLTTHVITISTVGILVRSLECMTKEIKNAGYLNTGTSTKGSQNIYNVHIVLVG